MKRLMLCGVAAFSLLGACGSEVGEEKPSTPAPVAVPVGAGSFSCNKTVGEYRDGLGYVQAAVLNHPDCTGGSFGG